MIHGLSTVGMVGPTRSRFIRRGAERIRTNHPTQVTQTLQLVPGQTSDMVDGTSASPSATPGDIYKIASDGAITGKSFKATSSTNMILTNSDKVFLQQDSGGTALVIGSGGGNFTSLSMYIGGNYRAYIGSGGFDISNSSAPLNYGGVFGVLGKSFFKASAATDVVNTIVGAASQSANLQEWQNSSSTILARVLAAGTAEFGGLFFGDVGFGSTYPAIRGLTASTNDYALLTALDGSSVALNAKTTSGTVDMRIGNNQKLIVTTSTITTVNGIPLVLGSSGLRGVNGSGLNAAGSNTLLQGGQGTGTGVGGNVVIQVAPVGSTGSSLNTLVDVVTISSATQNVLVNCTAATVIPQVIRGASSQSANLMEWQNSSSTRLYSLDKLGRPNTANTIPTITAGTASGTAPTVSITGTDVNGVISVTAGAIPSASASVVTITFSAAYGTAPKTVIITAANSGAAALNGLSMVYVTNITTTTFDINVGSTPLIAATQYQWYYEVLG